MRQIAAVYNHCDDGLVFVTIKHEGYTVETPWFIKTPAAKRILFYLAHFLRRETEKDKGWFIATEWGWMWLRYGGKK